MYTTATKRIKPARFPEPSNQKDPSYLPNKQNLSVSDIEYLALEGGGGKGNAFIGAIEAMESPKKHKTGKEKGKYLTNYESKKLNILQKKFEKNGIELTVNNKKTIKRIKTLYSSKIKGISGSSAGAITALFLSMGMTSEEMKYFMDILDMDEVEKPSRLGDRPVLKAVRAELKKESVLINQIARDGKFKSEFRSEHKKLKKHYSANPARLDREVAWLASSVDVKMNQTANRSRDKRMENPTTEIMRAVRNHRRITNSLQSIPGLAVRFLFWWRNYFKKASQKASKPGFSGKIMRLFLGEYNKVKKSYLNPNTLLYSLQIDKGYLTGSHLHSFFDLIIALRMYEVLIARGDKSTDAFNKVKDLNFTFRELYRVFGIQLVITGSNLSTGKSGLFSCVHTPDFPVATAVRISMSLPLYFKPVVINKNNPYGLGKEYVGHWWDGGLFNNAPFRVFDYLHPTSSKPKTLLIRLEQDKPKDLEKFSEFIEAYLLFMMGNGESHVSLADPRFNQFITLKTTGYNGGDLSTFNFKEKDQNKLNHYYKEARETVFEYFKKAN